MAAREHFGKTPNGSEVEVVTLTNAQRTEVRIITYGGTVVSLKVADSRGAIEDVVLGFDSLEQYIAESPYFGALIGRYGNRIGGARFSLGGRQHRITANDGANSLHGGAKGYDKVVWKVEDVPADRRSVVLSYESKDGEEGYPGNLSVQVAYALDDDNELRIDYRARCDRQTVVNLTHHSYFNLAGAGNGDVLDHVMRLYAETFTPVDAGLIPTGEIRSVKGTPYDFTTPVAIGKRIESDDEQLNLAGGYDFNWVVDGEPGTLRPAARVEEPRTGRIMEVDTTEPGIQFYSGNFLDGKNIGKGGKRYGHRYGFCLETQHFPDSPNKPQFPSTTLQPGRTFSSTTVYRFLAARR